MGSGTSSAFAMPPFTRVASRRKETSPTRVSIMDVESAHDAIALMRRTVRTQADETDDIFERLVNMFKAFPPTQSQMARFSLLQQKYSNNQFSGGLCEFACTTVYAAATVAMNDHRFPTPVRCYTLLRRSHSAPATPRGTAACRNCLCAYRMATTANATQSAITR